MDFYVLDDGRVTIRRSVVFRYNDKTWIPQLWHSI